MTMTGYNFSPSAGIYNKYDISEIVYTLAISE